MSRLIKPVLMGAYSALFILFIKSLFVKRNVEIVELKYIVQSKILSVIEHELIKYKRVVSLVNMEAKKIERLPTDYKYVLKWSMTSSHFNSPVYLGGQRPFLQNNCTFTNCFMSNDKTILTDIKYFDAILFDVENVWDFHPIQRSQYQYYVFLGAESSDNFPLCHQDYENYYNLTWSYKLDSDIRWSYVTILDKNGTVVGPKTDMNWIHPMSPTPDNVRRIIKGKNKTAAWFVSTCNTKSNRQNLTDHLKDALMKFGLEIDVYGWCGPLRCPRDRIEDCLELLEQQYYFYLSFENSFAEDYVTEKLLHPLLHHTVPIVYGGANYSRFLPPESYIDARALDVKAVAFKIFQAISHPEIYEKYFRWHNYYTYKQNPEAGDVCNLCQILNAPITFKSKKNFRQWWNPDYKDICSKD